MAPLNQPLLRAPGSGLPPRSGGRDTGAVWGGTIARPTTTARDRPCSNRRLAAYQREQGQVAICPGPATPAGSRPHRLSGLGRRPPEVSGRHFRPQEGRGSWGGHHHPEALVVVPVVGVVPVPVGGADVPRIVVPRAATHHPAAASGRPPQHGELTPPVLPPSSSTRPADGRSPPPAGQRGHTDVRSTGPAPGPAAGDSAAWPG